MSMSDDAGLSRDLSCCISGYIDVRCIVSRYTHSSFWAQFWSQNAPCDRSRAVPEPVLAHFRFCDMSERSDRYILRKKRFNGSVVYIKMAISDNSRVFFRCAPEAFEGSRNSHFRASSVFGVQDTITITRTTVSRIVRI